MYGLPFIPGNQWIAYQVGNVLIAYQAGNVLIAYLASWADGALSFSPCGAYVGQRHSRKDKEPAQVQNWLSSPRFWGCLLVLDTQFLEMFGDCFHPVF